MDGKADLDKIRIIEVDGGGRLAIIPIEDLIADRLGQAFADKPPREDMLNQAVMIYRLAGETDENYLNKRISEETDGDANLAWLKRACDEGREAE